MSHLRKESWLLNHDCSLAHGISFCIWICVGVLYHPCLTDLFGQQIAELPESCLREIRCCCFSATKENARLSGGAKLIKRELLRRKSFPPPFCILPRDQDRGKGRQSSCAQTCVEKFLQHKVALCREPVSRRPAAAGGPWANMNKCARRKGASPGSFTRPPQLATQSVRAGAAGRVKSWGIYKREFWK